MYAFFFFFFGCFRRGRNQRGAFLFPLARSCWFPPVSTPPPRSSWPLLTHRLYRHMVVAADAPASPAREPRSVRPAPPKDGKKDKDNDPPLSSTCYHRPPAGPLPPVSIQGARHAAAAAGDGPRPIRPRHDPRARPDPSATAAPFQPLPTLPAADLRFTSRRPWRRRGERSGAWRWRSGATPGAR